MRLICTCYSETRQLYFVGTENRFQDFARKVFRLERFLLYSTVGPDWSLLSPETRSVIRRYGSTYRMPRKLVLSVRNDGSWAPRVRCDVREARERESAHREERVCVAERER